MSTTSSTNLIHVLIDLQTEANILAVAQAPGLSIQRMYRTVDTVLKEYKSFRMRPEFPRLERLSQPVPRTEAIFTSKLVWAQCAAALALVDQGNPPSVVYLFLVKVIRQLDEHLAGVLRRYGLYRLTQMEPLDNVEYRKEPISSLSTLVTVAAGEVPVPRLPPLPTIRPVHRPVNIPAPAVPAVVIRRAPMTPERRTTRVCRPQETAYQEASRATLAVKNAKARKRRCMAAATRRVKRRLSPATSP